MLFLPSLLCSIISDISVLKLKVDKCSRQDNLFMKKVNLDNAFVRLLSDFLLTLLSMIGSFLPEH